METIFIHDASSGLLIIEKVQSADEETAIAICEREGPRFKDCEWGGVSSISINI